MCPMHLSPKPRPELALQGPQPDTGTDILLTHAIDQTAKAVLHRWCLIHLLPLLLTAGTDSSERV